MFNGRRERENVSFHFSNAHVSSLSHTHTHTHTHLMMSVRMHTFLPRQCASGADMRGIVGKLVFRRKRTGQAALKPRDKLHRRRAAAQSHRLWFHSVRRERGSKPDGAGFFFHERRNIIRRTTLTVQPLVCWPKESVAITSRCSLRIRQNCSFCHLEHLLESTTRGTQVGDDNRLTQRFGLCVKTTTTDLHRCLYRCLWCFRKR